MKANGREIGLAVVGCGVVGRIRAMLAKDYPGVGWIGVCDIDEKVGRRLAADCGADFFTTDFNELVGRPEVNATIVATDAGNHVEPTLRAAERGHALFIEKPLATDAVESERVLGLIRSQDVDAVLGYTQRFRRRFLAVKQRVDSGQIGQVTSAVTRALMNRMVPIGAVRNTNARKHLTPMVISGTHSLDISLWILADKKPVSVFARSTDVTLRQYGTKDATFGVFTMDDGAIFSMNINWALPIAWPGSVYGLEVGIVGTEGAIDIEDTHRDLVLVSDYSQGVGWKPEGFDIEVPRHVDFLTSFPPGDTYEDQLWGPMREETVSWYRRIYYGHQTPHATAQEGHDNLVLCMAMDLSAQRKQEVALPVTMQELME